MIELPFKLILGSKSPRRSSLMEQMGISFEKRSKEVDESFPEDLKKEEVAEYLSRKKAAAFNDELREDEVIICSDTTVVLKNKILGKAENREEAIKMLESLSAKKHYVISGVCISSKNHAQSFSVKTKVYFKKLKREEIEYYVDTYHPFDKAGAYGIQEWIGMIGVEKIKGSYFNVVGLPVKELYEELKRFKI